MQGKSINGFILQRLLGTGGMAEVWYAENEIGMKAAVKILSEELSHNAQMQERFLNEAKVMVRLDHPNIRKVYGYGSIDNRPAIIMEFLDGSDLKARMKRGQYFTNEELQRWWNQMVDALNYTHAYNIVHRDIKPSNIFIDQKGDAKLLDFGIAKIADTTSGTLTGSTLGTRIYMSPEQVKDPKRVGTASDVYSLAVSFVHLLTGKAPYNSTTTSDYEIQVSIVTKPVDMSKVPAEWQSFLTPYLNKEADKRPALVHFNILPIEEKETKKKNDDETITDELKPQPKAQPSTKDRHSGTPSTPSGHSRTPPFKGAGGIKDSLSPTPNDKPKNKKALWIGLGITAAAVVALLLLLKPKQEPIPTDPDTQAYEACQTVADYRAYKNDFGCNALHYADAMAFIEQHVADSLKRVQDSLAQLEAQQLAQQQAQAEQEAQAEVEKKEDEAYKKCTTIEGCNAYLKAYPQGRYVDKVHQKRDELSKAASIQQAKTVSGSFKGHDYVDLGLPSGTLWATCNVGASKPEGYGNYYAWGETNPKKTYTWGNYKHANGDQEKLTKYCNQEWYGNDRFRDKLTVLQPDDDAATANWGSGWQSPSDKQWKELNDNTTSTWTIQNGVKGMSFIGSNGNTLFLPAAGYYDEHGHMYSGRLGKYWSCTAIKEVPNYCRSFGFASEFGNTDSSERSQGLSVRAVRSSQ